MLVLSAIDRGCAQEVRAAVGKQVNTPRAA
jgi:hypothetical protein